MAKTYDQKSYELAEHFLQDVSWRHDTTRYQYGADSLAKCIQQTVEDWFAFDASHYVTFQHDKTGRWRAQCSCGWSLTGTQAEVQTRAAVHDFECEETV